MHVAAAAQLRPQAVQFRSPPCPLRALGRWRMIQTIAGGTSASLPAMPEAQHAHPVNRRRSIDFADARRAIGAFCRARSVFVRALPPRRPSGTALRRYGRAPKRSLLVAGLRYSLWLLRSRWHASALRPAAPPAPWCEVLRREPQLVAARQVRAPANQPQWRARRSRVPRAPFT